MMSKKIILSMLLINLISFTSCSQIENPKNYVEINAFEEEPVMVKRKNLHQYGGWSCPDNLRTFPAMNVQDLDNIPIVNGRLPTKEETQNGASLMYFDTTQLRAVKPLNMRMPRLARYYSEHTKKNELIVVIQGASIETDTVVGFRYLNGGNGSAWLDEVAFLSDDEIEQLGSTPFVTFNTEIKASKESVWKVITNPVYAESLGNMFNKDAFTDIDKPRKSRVHYKYAPESSINTGLITAVWKNLYLQIDYNFDGQHYAQKILILENETSKTTQLYIVAGPYGENFEAQNEIWDNWFQKVKVLSEGILELDRF